MREILFRGQTRRYGEKVRMGDGEKMPSKWVYGGIFSCTGDFSIIYGAEKEDFTGEEIEKHTVYSDTVGQYTGLTDKKGKQIFEGDIVKMSFVDGEDVGEIAWDEERCRFAYFEADGWGYGVDETVVCEIIGNIYDNPELLEGE